MPISSSLPEAVPEAVVAVDPLAGMQQANAELVRYVGELRRAPAARWAALRQRLRGRLEAQRQVLLGRQTVLPESLRHYAVSLTEVQWLLDAWISGAEAEDEPQLRRDFFEAAARLLGDEDLRPSPEPVQAPGGLRQWWHSALRRLRGEPATREAVTPLSERPDLPA